MYKHTLKHINYCIYKTHSELHLMLINMHLGSEDSTTAMQLQNNPPNVIPFAIKKCDSSPHLPVLERVGKTYRDADKEIKIHSYCPHHLSVLLFTAHLVIVTTPERLWNSARPFGNKRTFLLN